MKLLFKDLRSFLVIFFCILTADIIFKNFDCLFKFRYISKFLVTISLFIHFYYNSFSFSKKERTLVFLALAFSFVADYFLLNDTTILFTALGMSMFIIAKIFYSLFYYTKAKFNVDFLLPFLAVTFIYYLFVSFFLYEGLGVYFVPVIIYVLASVGMIFMSYSRYRTVNDKSYILVLMGAFLFLASETIFAVDKFYTPLSHIKITLMVSYGLSQLFTIRGIIEQNASKN